MAEKIKGIKGWAAKKFFQRFEEVLIEKSEKNDASKLGEDDIIEMIQEVSLSTNQTIKILKIVRQKFPDLTLISPNIRELLIKRNKLFKKFFTTKKVIFEDKAVPTTYCHDIEGFLEESSKLEGYDYSSKLNVIGADIGLGAFTFTLTQPEKKTSVSFEEKPKIL